ncbi:hypothetical protein [Thermocrinis sp.]|uniref:hypothetical protein n=1 Tax=Thermocrinis sp. TaxID=2024383 RepID=UPI002FDD020D
MLKKLFLEDFHYKALSLVIGFLFWFVLNFGTKSVVSVEKELEIRNAEERYSYKLSRKKVRMKIHFVEKLASADMVDGVKPFVDVRGLSVGRHALEVQVSNPYKLIVSVEKLEPERVEVYITETPRRGE